MIICWKGCNTNDLFWIMNRGQVFTKRSFAFICFETHVFRKFDINKVHPLWLHKDLPFRICPWNFWELEAVDLIILGWDEKEHIKINIYYSVQVQIHCKNVLPLFLPGDKHMHLQGRCPPVKSTASPFPFWKQRPKRYEEGFLCSPHAYPRLLVHYHLKSRFLPMTYYPVLISSWVFIKWIEHWMNFCCIRGYSVSVPISKVIEILLMGGGCLDQHYLFTFLKIWFQICGALKICIFSPEQ